MRIALFQPEIAGNVGTILRLGACFATPVDLIEPLGFPFSDRALARAGMDYRDAAQVKRHVDWPAFRPTVPGRLVLLTTRATLTLPAMRFQPDDTLLMGSESAGVPDHVHAACDAAVRIPMRAGCRSLNVAVATGIALAEALRQTETWPET